MLRAGLVSTGFVAGFLIGIFTERALQSQIRLRSSCDASARSADESISPHPAEKKSSFLFDIPASAKEVVVNIGSNLDPILPTEAMGPCAHSIAVEPIVGCRIPPHRQLSVISAAVSAEPGVRSMRIYNNNSLSSSLSKPARVDWWNNKPGRDGKLALVPVITLSSIIHAIPNTTKVAILKTDMQGFDFVAIKEAASVLKERVSHFSSEVWFDDKYSYHAENDFCRDWLPFMTELGYSFAKMEGDGRWTDAKEASHLCAKQLELHPERPAVEASAGLREGDAFWIRNDALTVPFPEYRGHANSKIYSDEDYASCD